MTSQSAHEIISEKPRVLSIEVGSGCDGLPHHATAREVEGQRVVGITDEEARFLDNFTPELRTKLRRKVYLDARCRDDSWAEIVDRLIYV